MSKLKAGLVAGLVTLSGLGVGSGQADAATCYGDWCSGQDPSATGCTVGAYTVSAAHVYAKHVFDIGAYNYAGYLELRWSPLCGTNWARFTPQRGYAWILKAVQPETGYTQKRLVSGWQMQWTALIYSPQKCVYAHIRPRWPYTGTSYKTACI